GAGAFTRSEFLWTGPRRRRPRRRLLVGNLRRRGTLRRWRRLGGTGLVGFAGDHPNVIDGVFERGQRWRGSKHPAREHALQLITGLAVVNLDERRRLGRLF